MFHTAEHRLHMARSGSHLSNCVCAQHSMRWLSATEWCLIAAGAQCTFHHMFTWAQNFKMIYLQTKPAYIRLFYPNVIRSLALIFIALDLLFYEKNYLCIFPFLLILTIKSINHSKQHPKEALQQTDVIKSWNDRHSFFALILAHSRLGPLNLMTHNNLTSSTF